VQFLTLYFIRVKYRMHGELQMLRRYLRRASRVINYRPISLFCKIFERVIKQQMLSYLSAHKLITRQQHGFLSMHSTCTQLLETVNDWTLSLRDRHVVDTIYFDFSKAFDSVSFAKLELKLAGYGSVVLYLIF